MGKQLSFPALNQWPVTAHLSSGEPSRTWGRCAMQPASLTTLREEVCVGFSIPFQRLAGGSIFGLALDSLTLGVCHVFCSVLI